MAQTSYSYKTPQGIAGSLFDISPYSIDSRINGEESISAMRFGMGVMQGKKPGGDVLVPTAEMTTSQFEGIVLTGFTQQMNMQGEVQVLPGQTIGVLRWGKAWARVQSGVSPSYGERCYLITAGSDAGMFTNAKPDEGEGVAVKAKFIGGLGTGDVAPVELFNQLAE